MTGLDEGYKARRALHMYIMDLLMGHNPWLNDSSACTFPSKTSFFNTLHLKKSIEFVPSNYAYNFTTYEGTYSNYGLGSVTVKHDNISNNLYLLYGSLGKWILHRSSIENIFVGKGIDHVWAYRLDIIEFQFLPEQKHKANSVILKDFEPEAPPIFVRDLELLSSSCSLCSISVTYITTLVFAFWFIS